MDHLIQALLRAQELGMMGEEYVWFLYSLHPDRILTTKTPWLLPSAVEKDQGVVLNLTEEEVASRRQAFYRLKMVKVWYLWAVRNLCPFKFEMLRCS